ncbi:MAG: hypothetical protein QXR53_01850 [Candidatus Norongarragalinales archaeon]
MNGFWALVLLLVLLVEPLRDSLWGLLLGADALSLLAVLIVVWFLASGD